MKRLYKDDYNGMVSGVCAGIGAYIGIDPSLIRIFWVVFTLFSRGFGFFLYLGLMLLLPRKSLLDHLSGPAAPPTDAGTGERPGRAANPFDDPADAPFDTSNAQDVTARPWEHHENDGGDHSKRGRGGLDDEERVWRESRNPKDEDWRK